MIILITGASHTGKTLLSQRLLETCHYPYLSIDHLKMGLIRSGNTKLTTEDDDALTEYLWPIVREKVSFLRMLRDHLNPGGQILIGDVAFETRSQLEQCRKDVGDEWDDEEIYFIVDELKKDFPSLAFEQVSYCAGILSLALETNMKQIFESDKISFVEVSECLVNDYLTMVNDYENVNRFIGGKKKSFTVEQELQWVQEKLEEKALVFSMIDKASGRFIGNIELMDPNDSEGELGIAITAEMQDRGHGTEAVLAMVNYAIDHLGLKRVFLRTNPQNARAIRVYEKCGFRKYKQDSEHVYMEVMR